MPEQFLILRRSEVEREVFGGDVYIDIDGKNVGVLGGEDYTTSLSPGKHVLRMYKSHTLSTFIGVDEKEFEIEEGTPLFARYSPPMLATQPGIIIVASYESKQQLDELSSKLSSRLHADVTKAENDKARRQAESTKNNSALFVWIFVVPTIVGLLWWLVFSIQMNSLLP